MFFMPLSTFFPYFSGLEQVSHGNRNLLEKKTK